ncbi:flavodoxin [Actinoplanes lutulentus]|uniref:Flavodoxin n=1 Tax=Actinoplanes lutulentus TaxID=1287878 RepID=A0A327Z2A8_9ACTN|nr:flavodoxin [Actinoplanes lutulentus]MBB2946319.1 flavodoxin [Actinoplanes lutulentus]RAK28742.1 flavodoxin [Actinoplanes lutulentus]
MAAITRRDLLALTTLAAAGAGLAGCSRIPGLGGDAAGSGEALGRPLDGARTLVAYFSLPLTDNPDGMNSDEENSTHVVDGKVLGNTQYVAQLIGARTGAELFRIETAQPLPLDFGVLEKQALQEQESGTRPELKALIPNLGDYDTVFVGYPIYWYDLPMPLYTFLEGHDFNGKTIIPFTTHGGSRLSGTVERIAEKLAKSTVSGNAFTISRDDMDSAPDEVGTWLDSLGAA